MQKKKKKNKVMHQINKTFDIDFYLRQSTRKSPDYLGCDVVGWLVNEEDNVMLETDLHSTTSE